MNNIYNVFVYISTAALWDKIPKVPVNIVMIMRLLLPGCIRSRQAWAQSGAGCSNQMQVAQNQEFIMWPHSSNIWHGCRIPLQLCPCCMALTYYNTRQNNVFLKNEKGFTKKQKRKSIGTSNIATQHFDMPHFWGFHSAFLSPLAIYPLGPGTRTSSNLTQL